MVLLNMLMEIGLPKMRGLLVMTMASIFPSGREVPRRNHSTGGQKYSCPSSASRRRRSTPKVFSLFFLGKNDLYTRRWAPEVDRGEHNPPGHAQVGCGHLVSPLWYLLAPIFLKYSIKILRKVSACLGLCRIGGLM